MELLILLVPIVGVLYLMVGFLLMSNNDAPINMLIWPYNLIQLARREIFTKKNTDQSWEFQMPIVKNVPPFTAGQEFIPFRPDKGFYITINGIEVFASEDPETYAKLLTIHTDIIQNKKSDSDES